MDLEVILTFAGMLAFVGGVPGGMEIEEILTFIPRRLANEDGRIGIQDTLVMGSARVLEDDLSAQMDGALFQGSEWFPETGWIPEDEWFPRELFVAEEGLEGTRVVAFRDAEWVPNEPLFAGPGRKDLLTGDYEVEPAQIVEAGTSLDKIAAEKLLLFGAAGHRFFPQDGSDGEFTLTWDELAEEEITTVLEL